MPYDFLSLIKFMENKHVCDFDVVIGIFKLSDPVTKDEGVHPITHELN